MIRAFVFIEAEPSRTQELVQELKDVVGDRHLLIKEGSAEPGAFANR